MKNKNTQQTNETQSDWIKMCKLHTATQLRLKVRLLLQLHTFLRNSQLLNTKFHPDRPRIMNLRVQIHCRVEVHVA